MGSFNDDHFYLVDEIIDAIVEDIDLSAESGKFAKQILMDANGFGITDGRIPDTLATAALYIACVYRHEKVTQTKLAKSCGVCQASIRINYKRLVKGLNACLPVKFADYYRKWYPLESNAWLRRWRQDWEKEFFEDEVEVSKNKSEGV